MKVYSKKNLGTSKAFNLFSWIIMTFFALCSPLALFNIITGKQEYSSFIELIGTVILLAGILIAYIYMIFKPTQYNLRLVHKSEEEYKGKKITNMIFSGPVIFWNSKTSKEVYCYSIGDNELEIDKKYRVITSKFDGLPIRVEND